MPVQKGRSGLVGAYARQIGEPETADEAYGYLLFVLGLLLRIVGMGLFLPSESAGSTRELSVALGAAGLALLIAGPVIRLPLQRAATLAVYLEPLCRSGRVVHGRLPQRVADCDRTPGGYHALHRRHRHHRHWRRCCPTPHDDAVHARDRDG